MTPELAQLQAQVAELMTWKKEREAQQISYPLDEVSSKVLGVPNVKNIGLGTATLTQTYSVVGGAGGTVTAPKAYLDTLVLAIDDVNYEIPYVAIV